MRVRIAWPISAVLAFCTLLALSISAAAQPSDADRLLAAAHDQHLWFVLESSPPGKGFTLCHAATGMGEAHYRPQIPLVQPPLALAAWKNRVWLVFGSDGTGSSRPEVYTIAVSDDATLGRYVTQPRDRLEVSRSLPDGGRLIGFIGTPRGPAALLAPATQQDKPRLLQLQSESGGWVELELPDLTAGQDVRLGQQGPIGEQLFILAAATGESERVVKYDRLDEPPSLWSQTTIDLNWDDVRSLAHVAGQAVAVSLDRTRPDVEQLEIAMLRPVGAIPLATLPKPEDRWTVVGVNNRLRILQRNDQGVVIASSIDPLSGKVSDPVTMIVQPISPARMWQMIVLIALTIAALLMLILVRPAKREVVQLPKGLALLPMSQRAMGLAVDLIPGALVAMILMRVKLGELFSVPMFTTDLEKSVPYLIMIAVAIVHGTVGELVWNKSLGKALLGARIVSLNGASPRRTQVLLRGVVKLLTLLVPPLAIIVVLNQHNQGLHDMAASTLVIHEEDEAPPK